MIPSEKDRLECLKLAVHLFVPIGAKDGLQPSAMAAQVVMAAALFYQFTTKEMPDA